MARTHSVHQTDNGVTLNAITEIRHFHYRGLGSKWNTRDHCTPEAGGEGMERNEELAILARVVRECPLGTPTVCDGPKGLALGMP